MRFDRHFIKETLPLVGVVFFAVVLLWEPPERAANLATTPDSVEYAIAARNYATHGVCEISYCGKWFPMRYPPWFSVFVISPAYRIFGLEIGCAVIPVFIFGVVGAVLAFFLGRAVSDDLGGWMAALLLLALPLYRAYSKVVMTDIPAAVLALAAALLYLRMVRRRDTSLQLFLAAGFLVAFATSFRPLMLVLAFPFLSRILLPTRRCCGMKSEFSCGGSWMARMKTFAAFALPLLLFFCMAAHYNKLNFGSPFRNGYNYWCPIPYDYPSLTFSPLYILRNFKTFLKTSIPFLLAILVVALILRRRMAGSRSLPDDPVAGDFRSLLFFSTVVSALIILFHLLYFYSERRFYLPIEAFCVVLVGGGYSMILPKRAKRGRGLVGVALVVAAVPAAAVLIFKHGAGLDYNRKTVVDRINSVTPPDAVVISSIDPVYLNFMTRLQPNSDRIVIPTSRNVEYASKLIAPKKPARLNPPPARWWAHRDPRLIAAGAEEAIPWTANDNPEVILGFAATGRRIFIDTTHITKGEFAVFDQRYGRRFRCLKVSPRFFELIPLKRQR